MVFTDNRKPSTPGVYNHFNCLKIAPKHLLCSRVNWHHVGFSKIVRLIKNFGCRCLQIPLGFRISSCRLSDLQYREPVSNCNEILQVGAKYAFTDVVTKPFLYVSFAYLLLYHCIGNLYFSGKLEWETNLLFCLRMYFLILLSQIMK